MLCRLLRQNIIHRSGTVLSHCSMSSSTGEVFTNERLQRRLTPYLDKTPGLIEEYSKDVPQLKRKRRASVLVPLYCNEKTNRVEVLLIKRSEKLRSHTGMVAFPGGMADPTDRDSIHTAQREAFEEIGLEPHQYSIVGCLLPITDMRLVLITPVVALIHSPKFVDFRLSEDEVTEAFYVDLELFLDGNENYEALEVGDDFLTHHFQVDKKHIWGVTAYELIILATLVFQRPPNFPVYRDGKYLQLENITDQQRDFFRMCINGRFSNSNKEKSRL